MPFQKIVIDFKANYPAILSWCPTIEDAALAQIKDIVMFCPFVKHAAVMPDGHLGKENGLCIGGVVACENVVVPNFVGADHGCGMGAIRTSLKKSDIMSEDVDKRHILHNLFSAAVPVGHLHNTTQKTNWILKAYGDKIDYIIDKSGVNFTIEGARDFSPDIGKDWRRTMAEQAGTLGGGNHFLEVQFDSATDDVWVMVHSGSRNIGLKIGDHFNELAAEMNNKWLSSTPRVYPFLPTNTDEGQAYLAWLDFALRFAFFNRALILDSVKECLIREFEGIRFTTSDLFECTNDILNIHHNYAALENHFGKNYWIHRKGATMAREGQIGIIPGSMDTKSYITIGLGNESSMTSSSHGSGRRYGRKDFNVSHQDKVKEIEDSMLQKGIVFSPFKKAVHGRDKGMIDISETGGAYKDIVSVMEDQRDLVKSVVELCPMISLKG